MSDSKIYIVGVGMTHFGRHLEASISELLDTAILRAADDAGCTKAAVEAVYHSSATQGFLQGQTFVPGQVALSKIGLTGIPAFNIENACASSSSSFHLAVQALKAGMQDVVLAAGVEKMNVPDKARMFAVFDGGWDVETPEENAKRLLQLGEGVAEPEGSESERPYSVFMKIYAAFGRNHMKRYGTTQRQIAAIAAKNHQHSEHNEYSQYRQPYTIDEILSAPPITYPLTLPMCSPISDGAAALVLSRESVAKENGQEAVAKIVAMAAHAQEPSEFTVAPIGAIEKVLSEAGWSADDVDLWEVNEAFACVAMFAMRDIGIPHEKINVNGGGTALGHPIGASGARIIVTLLNALKQQGKTRGVASLCIGGGEATAVALEIL